jgi:hypothetical protein
MWALLWTPFGLNVSAKLPSIFNGLSESLLPACLKFGAFGRRLWLALLDHGADYAGTKLKGCGKSETRLQRSMQTNDVASSESIKYLQPLYVAATIGARFRRLVEWCFVEHTDS